jgi:hypothetical protein
VADTIGEACALDGNDRDELCRELGVDQPSLVDLVPVVGEVRQIVKSPTITGKATGVKHLGFAGFGTYVFGRWVYRKIFG